MYFCHPWSPLGLKLRRYVSDSDLQELTGHVLFGVRYIAIAVWKDAHAHKTPGRRGSEITYRESVSAGIRFVDNGKGERVERSAERAGAGRALIARIFVQKEARNKLRRLPGGAIGNPVTVVSAKCISTVLPFSGVVVRWIKHLEARAECWQNHGRRAKGLMDIEQKLILPAQRGSRQRCRQY